jgi:hypothetical protein
MPTETNTQPREEGQIIGYLLRLWEGTEIEKEREISVDDHGGSIKKTRRKAETLQAAWKKKYKKGRHDMSVTLTPVEAYIPDEDEEE